MQPGFDYSQYAAASVPRAQAFNAVAHQGDSRVRLVAIIYADKQAIAQSQAFESGAQPRSDSRYSTWPDCGSEVRKSKRDAEVHAMDWAYDTLRAHPDRRKFKNVQVDLVVSSGTCDECKERTERFRGDLKGLLPGTASQSQRGKYHIKVQPVYDNGSEVPAWGGRRDSTHRPTTTYGYDYSAGVERRVSAAALDAGTPYEGSQYWSRTHQTGSGAGYTDPRDVSREPYAGEPRTDRYSPTFSSQTPSPQGTRAPTPPDRPATPPGRRR